MKPSELAKRLLGAASQPGEMAVIAAVNLPAILLALRHHEALVEALRQATDAIWEFDSNGITYLNEWARAEQDARFELLATIEREAKS